MNLLQKVVYKVWPPWGNASLYVWSEGGGEGLEQGMQHGQQLGT